MQSQRSRLEVGLVVLRVAGKEGGRRWKIRKRVWKRRGGRKINEVGKVRKGEHVEENEEEGGEEEEEDKKNEETEEKEEKESEDERDEDKGN